MTLRSVPLRTVFHFVAFHRIQSTQIERVYEENDGDEAAIRATLNAKLAEYKLWFRSPKRAGEKRTAVEQEVEGTKNLLKRAK